MGRASNPTPGPWETGGGAGETVFAAMRNGVRHKIASCYLANDSEESHANARLIAKAPEMLTMLLAIAECNSGDLCPMCRQFPHRHDCSLLAMIRKDEGAA